MTQEQAEEIVRKAWTDYGADGPLDQSVLVGCAAWIKMAFDQEWLVPSYDEKHHVRITEKGVAALQQLMQNEARGARAS